MAHLAEFKSSTEDLVLLLLKSSLGLLQSRLQLLLLLLQVAPLLVQVMDGSATLAKLVQQILDLVSQVLKKNFDGMSVLNDIRKCIYLVLPLDNVKLLNSLR